MSDRSKSELAAGVAALAICESLLIALVQLKVISGKELEGLLEDAAAPYSSRGILPKHAAELNTEIASQINGILSRNYAAWEVGL